MVSSLSSLLSPSTASTQSSQALISQAFDSLTKLAEGQRTISQANRLLPAPSFSLHGGGVSVTGGDGVVSKVGGISGVTGGLARINVTALAASAQLTGSATVTGTTAFQGGASFTLTGPKGSATFTTTAGETVNQLMTQINSSATGVKASLTTAGKLQLATADVGSGQSMAITKASGADVTTTLGLANGASSGTNASATVNGTNYTATSGNDFQIGGLAAGSLNGLKFTAVATGSTEVGIGPVRATYTPPVVPVQATNTDAARTSQFASQQLATASKQLMNALIMSNFTPLALQLQSQSYKVQGALFGLGF
jgi:hypothetical protein